MHRVRDGDSVTVARRPHESRSLPSGPRRDRNGDGLARRSRAPTTMTPAARPDRVPHAKERGTAIAVLQASSPKYPSPARRHALRRRSRRSHGVAPPRRRHPERRGWGLAQRQRDTPGVDARHPAGPELREGGGDLLDPEDTPGPAWLRGERRDPPENAAHGVSGCHPRG